MLVFVIALSEIDVHLVETAAMLQNRYVYAIQYFVYKLTNRNDAPVYGT